VEGYCASQTPKSSFSHCRALYLLKDSDRSAASKACLELMLPLRLDVSNAKDLPIIEALRGKDVPMTAVQPHGVGATAGVTAAVPRRSGSGAAGGDASPVAYVVDVKDVLLLGTKEALELVVTKYIHGCVTVLPNLDTQCRWPSCGMCASYPCSCCDAG